MDGVAVVHDIHVHIQVRQLTIQASQLSVVTKLLRGGLCDTFFRLVVYSKEKSVTTLHLFTLFHTDLIQSEANWKLSSTSDWLMSA